MQSAIDISGIIMYNIHIYMNIISFLRCIMHRVFIHGSVGTTGLRLRQRLLGRDDVELIEIDGTRRKSSDAIEACMAKAEVCFFCLPDEAAIEAAQIAQKHDCRIIDCSTAHRCSLDWTYGFPELSKTQRQKIRNAKYVSAPGCYASGIIAIVRPLIESGLLARDAQLSFHGISGYTGAGNAAINEYESTDREPELTAPRQYALELCHKHIPEIMAQTGLKTKPIFTPYICDFPCGMTVTLPIFVEQLDGVEVERLHRILSDFYSGASLIRVPPPRYSGFIASNAMEGRDSMELLVYGNAGQAGITACFDNLGKGASGAAIQCFNIMLGETETKGLVL